MPPDWQAPAGAEKLLDMVAAGKASARLLLRPASLRLTSTGVPDLKAGSPNSRWAYRQRTNACRNCCSSRVPLPGLPSRSGAGPQVLREKLRHLPSTGEQGRQDRSATGRDRYPGPGAAFGRTSWIPDSGTWTRLSARPRSTCPAMVKQSRACCCVRKARCWSWPMCRGRKSASPNARSRSASFATIADARQPDGPDPQADFHHFAGALAGPAAALQVATCLVRQVSPLGL